MRLKGIFYDLFNCKFNGSQLQHLKLYKIFDLPQKEFRLTFIIALMIILRKIMPRKILLILIIALFYLPVFVHSQEKAEESFEQKTEKLQKIDGFMPLYWDAKNGKMLLEIARFNREFLYQVSLPAGLGSNPVGLDRGQLGRTFVVYFERVGQKVLLVQPNYRYRALTTDEAEQKAVADSFAKSVIFGFKIEAEKDEKILVDATAFLMRDAHGVAEILKRAKQGNFKLDDSRSAFYLDRTKGFPLNTEIETTLTFAGEDHGQIGRFGYADGEFRDRTRTSFVCRTARR